MTRDEAIKVLRRTLFRDDKIPKELQELNEPCAGGWVDALVALGILKLDEPKFSPVEKLYYAMNNSYHCGLATFRATLEENGLRIVEK